MSMDRTNQWLSLLANLGVVAGIIFLALELQQNTNTSRTSAYQELNQEILEVRSWLVADDELRRNYEKYLGGNSALLDQDQISELSWVIRSFFSIYDNAYYFYSLGIIAESEWERFENAVSRQSRRISEDPRINNIPMSDEFSTFSIEMFKNFEF